MKATQILMEEHRVIERVLTALERAAQRANAGEHIRPAFFINAALFIKNFADGCHHKKEEGVLFQAMTEAGMPLEGGPIAVMLAEHEQGRAFTREMRDAAEQWDKGDQSALGAVVQNALGYVALLRQHIYKEDNILFPMAERVIPTDRHEKVAEDFERIEHEETGEGVHEKYLALAETLEKESQQKA
ncbi:MAG: hemerythrin domain-containing protein [Anaerolineales bacterium]